MTIQQFVTNYLQVPVTLAGNKLIIEAIEIVLDTQDYDFYPKLSEISKKSPRQLEKPMRDAKNKSLEYINSTLKQQIFGSTSPTVKSYVILAAEYYRRLYEKQR